MFSGDVNSLTDFTKGPGLDILVAFLLLTGKLRVDGILLYRGSASITITLVGKFDTKKEDVMQQVILGDQEMSMQLILDTLSGQQL
ncbi:hypothetical protein FLK61_33695 [Paenalkalicoccus suaedae]|uniref:Uncharacterized protein n=1 Tax=Paenalkalicoccus suaedae TaxID=2592382 RepID=A0A859FF86_9BACI|nr:hypothetical protein [Paenalkalicoccus suaedae]QKS71641.1 hypothetical protein FLK61_33695 [Paenalkalicoccus suaedae]